MMRSAAVDARPLARDSVAGRVAALAANARGLFQALGIVRRFRPDVVVGTGGYVTVPVIAAAAILRALGRLPATKIALLEPNAEPGRANRSLARFADEVWGAYDSGKQFFGRKMVVTGVPVRPEILKLPDRAAARRALGLDVGATTVLVFGGSQGARSLNAAASAMVARRRLPATWQTLHVCGPRDYEWMATERRTEPNDNRYALMPYIDDMASAYAAADLAVCRAGASTLAELAAAGLPAILVPYPFAADDHQRKNADAFVRAGGAGLIGDAALDADSLYWALVEALAPETLTRRATAARTLARPDALKTIVDRILSGKIGQKS